MRLWVLSVVSCLIVLGTIQKARGGPLLVPTSQTRTLQVTATVFDKTDSDSAAASGFGDFDRSIQVHPYTDVAGERWAAQGNAAQKSSLGEHSFSFSGSLYAQSIHPANSSAHARNLFDVSFDVTQPARYSLNGFLRNPGNSPADAALTFTLLAGNKTLFSAAASDSALDSSGKLDAGAYRLLLDASGRGDSPEAGGAAEFAVTFMAAADVASVAPVPLPPAIWSGAIALSGIAAISRLRRHLRLT